MLQGILCKMLRKEKEKTASGGVMKSQESSPADESQSSLMGCSLSSVGSASGPIGNRKWTVNRQQTACAEREERNKTKIC